MVEPNEKKLKVVKICCVLKREREREREKGEQSGKKWQGLSQREKDGATTTAARLERTRTYTPGGADNDVDTCRTADNNIDTTGGADKNDYNGGADENINIAGADNYVDTCRADDTVFTARRRQQQRLHWRRGGRRCRHETAVRTYQDSTEFCSTETLRKPHQSSEQQRSPLARSLPPIKSALYLTNQTFN